MDSYQNVVEPNLLLSSLALLGTTKGCPVYACGHPACMPVAQALILPPPNSSFLAQGCIHLEKEAYAGPEIGLRYLGKKFQSFG